ncbi:MAG: type II toxin-antitoxin system Phd/YefM family antitoxin [Nocardioidaceae bacterium]
MGAYEAKTRLSALLDDVERGDSITITKHGRAVARLIPVDSSFSTPIADLLVDLDHHRTPRRDGDETIRELIDAGREH